MYPERSDARNETSPATSSGRPMRPIGMARCNSSRTASGSVPVMSVVMYPGATALTVMDRSASSLATAKVIPMSPALAAA